MQSGVKYFTFHIAKILQPFCVTISAIVFPSCISITLSVKLDSQFYPRVVWQLLFSCPANPIKAMSTLSFITIPMLFIRCHPLPHWLQCPMESMSEYFTFPARFFIAKCFAMISIEIFLGMRTGKLRAKRINGLIFRRKPNGMLYVITLPFRLQLHIRDAIRNRKAFPTRVRLCVRSLKFFAVLLHVHLFQ